MSYGLTNDSRRRARAYRSEIEIIEAVLRACKGDGSKKTHILYRANLNSKMLDKYLSRLVCLGAVVKVARNRTTYYMLTRRGRRLLSTIMRLRRELEDPNEDYKSIMKEILSLLESGVSYTVNGSLRGSSGVIHSFDLVIAMSRGLLVVEVSTGTGDELARDLMMFAMKVDDVGAQGVFLTTGTVGNGLRRMYPKVKVVSGVESSVKGRRRILGVLRELGVKVKS